MLMYSKACKWLIVFDNVEDFNELHAYLPTKAVTQGCVIITTQKTSFNPVTDVFQAIALTTLEPEEGAELMFRLLERPPEDEHDQETACTISTFVGGLALGLSTIAGYAHETRMSLPVILEELRNLFIPLTGGAMGPRQQYQKCLKSVLDLALRELPTRARSFITVLAFLNPDNIREELFVSNVPASPLYTAVE